MPNIRSSVVAAAVACVAAAGPAAVQQAVCAPDNVGLTLPPGFCATLVADSLGRPRHIVVAPNGDVFAAATGSQGGVVALRDTTRDGRADVIRRFGPGPGSGIALANGWLYFATDDAVVRWRWTAGQLEPSGPPDTIVSGLLSRRQHAAKTIAVTGDGRLFVNIGAPSNSCQVADRVPGSPGRDPCTMLDSAGGIWMFDANRARQRQSDGRRFATGLRNVVALALDPSGVPWAVQHGRDDLHRLWPSLFDTLANAEKPAEEMFRLEDGADYGWPYCYYDPELRLKVLAPEYGGDGRSVGRCAAARQPDVAFPAHWAPNALLFYTGSSFPVEYRGGVFVAFHGSWNRAPLPQQGFNVVYVPMQSGRPGQWRVFADGFRTAQAVYRPTGLAQGPDGSLYVSDDRGGRIYRISYRP